MTPPYTYHAFGLNIRSWIYCPELIPGGEGTEVTFSYGAVPATLETPVHQNQWYQAAPGAFLLLLPGIARYLIQDGAEIVIDPAPGASETEIRLFLLGSAMGVLLHQRGLLPLHASAIKLPGGGAALFAGHCGAGKSTLAAAWRSRGFPVLTDDVSVIALGRAKRPFLLPGYPEIKLLPDAIAKLGETLEALPRSRTLAEKYSLCFHPEFNTEPLPVRVIHILEPWEGDDFRLSSLEGAAKLAALVEHTYRVELLEPLGVRPAHFQLAAHVASQVRVTKVARPRSAFLVAELADFLERDLDIGTQRPRPAGEPG